MSEQLRAELAHLRARYDGGAISPAVYKVIRKLEIEIGQEEHKMYYPRQELEEGIKYLAKKYPKCFFEIPQQRRPLKQNILIDLDKEKDLNHEALSQVLDWYMSHFAYQYCLIAGTGRVNLSGEKAGTVTPTEEQEAKTRIAARRRQVTERQQQTTVRPISPPPISPVVKSYINGSKENMTSKPALHASLADVQTAIDIVNGFLTEPQYESMRAALTTTALRALISKAEELIDSLVGDPYAKLELELRGNGAATKAPRQ